MRGIRVSIALCLGLWVVAGCGAGGGGHGGRHADNPYIGYYFGTYVDVTKGVNGQIFFIVDGSGNVGSGAVVTNGSNQPVNGTITSSGLFSIQVQNGGTASGSLSASGVATLSGMLTTDKGHTVYVILLFNPVTLSGGNPIAGYYTGTFTNTTKNETGIISFVIGTSGTCAGMALVKPSGILEIANVNGNVTNAGALSFAFDAGGATINTLKGNVALANGALTGSFTSTGGDDYTLTVTPEAQMSQ